MIYVIRHLHHIWPDFDEGTNSNTTTDLSSVKFTIPNKVIILGILIMSLNNIDKLPLFLVYLALDHSNWRCWKLHQFSCFIIQRIEDDRKG